jgi:YbbR domain-containing protein
MNTLRRLPHAIGFLLRGGTLAVAGNLSLAVLSVALALTLWLYVTERENPQQVETFNSAIPVQFVNVPNNLAVANASVTSVRIQISAPKNQLSQLHPDDFEATVNLGGLDKGTSNIAVDVTSSNGSVNVTDVSPARVDVTLEDLRSKQVPVKTSLVGSPQLGFAPGDQSVDPQTVTVTGPESLVALVDSAVAEVNLTGLRVDFDDTIELKPRDVRGGEISRVTVNPEKAHVKVAIDQKAFTSAFVVTPDIVGAPAAGYNITSVTIDPPLVSLTGAADKLQSIDAVKGIVTQEISVADQRADVVRQVGLQLPDGVQIQGADQVSVRIAISPAKGEQSYNVVPQVRNVADGLAATPAEGTITVTLSGDVPALQAITPEAITVIVDAKDLGAGLYSLPISIQAPAGTKVVRTDPGQLGISLSKRQ